MQQQSNAADAGLPAHSARKRRALRAKGSFCYLRWRFRSEDDAVRIDGRIEAPREAFVGLRYYNPPGGIVPGAPSQPNLRLRGQSRMTAAAPRLSPLSPAPSRRLPGA